MKRRRRVCIEQPVRDVKHCVTNNTLMHRSRLDQTVARTHTLLGETVASVQQTVVNTIDSIAQSKKRRAEKRSRNSRKTAVEKVIPKPVPSVLPRRTATSLKLIDINEIPDKVNPSHVAGMSHELDSNSKLFDPNDTMMANWYRMVEKDAKGGRVSTPSATIEMLRRYDDSIKLLRENNSPLLKLKDPASFATSRLAGISKQWIDDNDFLVEPTGNARACASGQECVCYQIGVKFPKISDYGNTDSNAFIGREFLTPVQLERSRTQKRFPTFRRFCILCNRRLACVIWMKTVHLKDAMAEPSGEDHPINDSHRIQPIDHYYTGLDEPGGYRSDCTLPICPNRIHSSIDYPFMEFKENNYSYGRPETREDGKRFIVETNNIFRVNPGADATDPSLMSDFL